MSTNRVSAKDIKKEWRLVDAENRILGRLASDVAVVLMGKKKANYVPYLDMGDNVVIINAEKVKVSGRKDQQKVYRSHSGYPGGLKEKKLAVLREEKPREIVRHAVSGMVPKGRLGRQMIKKLHVFAGADHPFKRQLGVFNK